jgi:hypothetical protein
MFHHQYLCRDAINQENDRWRPKFDWTCCITDTGRGLQEPLFCHERRVGIIHRP